ncbi:hypothetical protein LguiA_032834 [Lonicera macranthoides]
MPLVFFYLHDIHNRNNAHRSECLKKSLSETLTHYYPMAGRAIDNLYNDCNDDGIPYVQARSTCQLSDIISDPVPNQLNGFFPCKLDEAAFAHGESDILCPKFESAKFFPPKDMSGFKASVPNTRGIQRELRHSLLLYGAGLPQLLRQKRKALANLIFFIDTPSEDGIEVWVNLKGEDMAKFEVDKELLSSVSH